MELLNDLYNQSCKPGYKIYKKVSDDVILIDNFFEDFDSARNFFISRDKWKCIAYQGHAKPGYESLFPGWVGKSLVEKFVTDHQINDDTNSYETLCNFIYESTESVWNLSNSNFFPHTDGVIVQVDNFNVLRQICLINLNNTSVSTNFYSYKNFSSCSPEMQDEWKKYGQKIQKELLKYYNKTNISGQELKNFLDQKSDLEIKLTDTITYKPNQAIIYSANLFHSAGALDGFTFEYPRVLLRITFDMGVKNKISKKTYL